MYFSLLNLRNLFCTPFFDPEHCCALCAVLVKSSGMIGWSSVEIEEAWMDRASPPGPWRSCYPMLASSDADASKGGCALGVNSLLTPTSAAWFLSLPPAAVLLSFTKLPLSGPWEPVCEQYSTSVVWHPYQPSNPRSACASTRPISSPCHNRLVVSRSPPPTSSLYTAMCISGSVATHVAWYSDAILGVVSGSGAPEPHHAW